MFCPFCDVCLTPILNTLTKTDETTSSFHTVSNHSREITRFGNQLDYLGIIIVMWGSTIPSDYYGFYCSPKLQYF